MGVRLKTFVFAFVLGFFGAIQGSWGHGLGSGRCLALLTELDQASISRYYAIKNEVDPDAEFESLDNKNLAGTFYSSLKKPDHAPLLKDHEELIIKIKDRFGLSPYQEVGLGSGVRSILKEAFRYYKKQGYEVFVPDDIYPVYKNLAQEEALEPREFQSIPSLTLPQGRLAKSLLVISSPLSPSGRSLNKEEIFKIRGWLREHTQRRVILDTVYTFANHFDQATTDLLAEHGVMAIHSFAKSYAIPGYLGFAVGYAHTFDGFLKSLPGPNLDLASRALAMVNADPGFPQRLRESFAERWGVIGLEPPENGYFKVLPIPSSELLKDQKRWGFPLSSFGSGQRNFSVVSALPNKIEKLYYVTVLSNFARGFDKYAMTYSKEQISESSFPNQFFLLTESELSIGVEKAKSLLTKTIPGDRVLVLGTSEFAANLLPNEKTGRGRFIRSPMINVENLYYLNVNGERAPARLEDVYADSLKLNNDKFVSLDKIVPRSISILPIAKACQACCKFCFSDSSISIEKRSKDLTPEMIDGALLKAKESHAERLVITGGGEPTLIGFPKLNDLVSQGRRYFPGRITLITNGMMLAKLKAPEILARLLELEASGLTVMAISRHHYDKDKNKVIMGVDTQTEKVLEVYRDHRELFETLKLRLICVIQKTGVDSDLEVGRYIDWARSFGVSEINFKELYVSTDRESSYTASPFNLYSESHRVHLKTILKFATRNQWTKIAELPWGAPIFEKYLDGMRMQIAAYTEPSVFWERTHGVARSWNLMADGKLMVSLEDGDSELEY